MKGSCVQLPSTTRFQPVRLEAQKGRREDISSWWRFAVCGAILPLFSAKKARERPIFVRYQREDDRGCPETCAMVKLPLKVKLIAARLTESF